MVKAARALGSSTATCGAVAHAQVRLVGVALLDEHARVERRRRHVGLGRGQVGEAPEELVDLPVGRDVVDVADDERAPARAGPAALAEGDDRVAREGPQVILGAQDGAAQRMVAEVRAVDELLGHRGGLVLVALDLLDDDAALLVELGGVDLRAPDEVGEQVDGLHGRLGAHGDVEGDEVVRGVGVQRAAHALGRLVDLAVVVVDLAALEHEVLEEVGHPVLVGALGAGAGVEADEDRRGARAREGDAVDRQPVGGDGGGDLRHRQMTIARAPIGPRSHAAAARGVDPP